MKVAAIIRHPDGTIQRAGAYHDTPARRAESLLHLRQMVSKALTRRPGSVVESVVEADDDWGSPRRIDLGATSEVVAT